MVSEGEMRGVSRIINIEPYYQATPIVQCMIAYYKWPKPSWPGSEDSRTHLHSMKCTHVCSLPPLVYCVEIILRIIGHGPLKYFRNFWHV